MNEGVPFSQFGEGDLARGAPGSASRSSPRASTPRRRRTSFSGRAAEGKASRLRTAPTPPSLRPWRPSRSRRVRAAARSSRPTPSQTSGPPTHPPPAGALRRPDRLPLASRELRDSRTAIRARPPPACSRARNRIGNRSRQAPAGPQIAHQRPDPSRRGLKPLQPAPIRPREPLSPSGPRRPESSHGRAGPPASGRWPITRGVHFQPARRGSVFDRP